MDDFIIESDFKVEKIGTSGNSKLFGGVKNFHYHFVVLSVENKSRTLDQYYVHRYELTKLVKFTERHKKLKNINGSFSNGAQITVNYDDSNCRIDLAFPNDAIEFENVFNGSLNSTLKEDLKKIKEVQVKDSIKDSYKRDILRKVLNDENGLFTDKIDLISDDVYNMLAFEFKLMEKKKKLIREPGMYSIYQIILRDELKITNLNKNLLFDGVELVLVKGSCDCGNKGCFFDLLKKSQHLYFDDDRLLKNGSLDKELADVIFNKLWENSTRRQKTVLLFLDMQFRNTALLNMVFWHDDFDLDYYLYLMCFPYQPDSDDEQWVRTIGSLANYFYRVERYQ